MGCIFPSAVTGLRTYIAIGVIRCDIVSEQEQRLVKAFGAIGTENLRAKEARTAGQDTNLEIFGREAVIRRIEDQRTAGIAASRRTFADTRFIFVEIEVKWIGLVRIVEVDTIKNLRQITKGITEKKRVAVIKRGQRAEHILGGFPSPVDAHIITRRAATGAAVACDVNMITGAIRIIDCARVGERRE